MLAPLERCAICDISVSVRMRVRVRVHVTSALDKNSLSYLHKFLTYRRFRFAKARSPTKDFAGIGADAGASAGAAPLNDAGCGCGVLVDTVCNAVHPLNALGPIINVEDGKTREGMELHSIKHSLPIVCRPSGNTTSLSLPQYPKHLSPSIIKEPFWSSHTGSILTVSKLEQLMNASAPSISSACSD